MTISSQTRKAGPFVGNGTVATFPFTFKVFQASDLQLVKLNSTTNVETQLVLTTDYTVSLNANQNTNPGGTITLTAGVLPTGYKLTITTNIAPLQAVDLTNSGGFYPSVINAALDKLTILVQQIIERAGRTLTLPLSTPTDVSASLPAPQANAFIGWDQTGKALQNYDNQSLATVVAYGTAKGDIFAGDGSTTQFNLTNNPGALNNLDVSVGGVTQLPNTDYAWNGGTLVTFTSAPPSGASVFVRYMQGLPFGTVQGADVVGGVMWENTIIGYDASDLIDGTVINFKGRDTVGDGGGGQFRYSASSTQTADGVFVFAPTGGGRLLRDGWSTAGFAGIASPLWAGAKGDSNAAGSSGTNDASAFALLEAAHAGKYVDLGGRYYLVNSPIPAACTYLNGKLVVAQATTDDQPANFALGPKALMSNTFVPRQHPSSTLTFASGNFNTAVGDNAMALNTTGRRNTALGSQSMYSNTTGYYNVAIGAYALYSNISGQYNVAVGNQALQFGTGSSNVAIGNGACTQLNAGNNNVGIGDSALTKQADKSIAIGTQAGQSYTGADSVAIGYQALSAPTASGQYNVVIGSAAGGSISTGAANVAIGRRALAASTTGSNNTAVGNDAMVSAGTGGSNVAIGSGALPSNTTGSQSVAIGVSALPVHTIGTNNVAVGRFAAQLLTEGSNNVAVGEQSMPSNVTGSNNVAVGKGAGPSGSANLNTTSLGYNAVCNANNQVTLGDANVTSFRCQVALTVLSDMRDKVRVSDIPGLAFVRDVDAFIAKWNKRDGSENPAGNFASLSAQNLIATQQKHGVNFGLVNDGDPERLEVTYERMIPVLVQAIVDLDREVSMLRKPTANN